MVLSNEKVNEILENALNEGITARVRDISYVILSFFYKNKEFAYKSVFGADSVGFEEYASSKVVKHLEKALSSMNPNKKGAKEGDITFEENKAYMLKLKRDTELAMQNGDIETKDGLKILTDISTKLNDKFSVNESVQEQLVIVTQKYDDICPYCSHEISRRPISKEEAKEMYKLVEKE